MRRIEYCYHKREGRNRICARENARAQQTRDDTPRQSSETEFPAHCLSETNQGGTGGQETKYDGPTCAARPGASRLEGHAWGRAARGVSRRACAARPGASRLWATFNVWEQRPERRAPSYNSSIIRFGVDNTAGVKPQEYPVRLIAPSFSGAGSPSCDVCFL